MLASDEIITEIRVPKPAARTGMAYSEFSHPASGYPVVGVCAVVRLNGNNNAQAVRVSVTGAGPKATRAATTERMLTGPSVTPELIEQASEQAADGIDLNGDIFTDADYRGHLTQVYTRRALSQALARASS